MEIAQKYKDAIEYLTKNPSEIREAWNCPFHHVAGCLFCTAGPVLWCGCLTQIRCRDSYRAATEGLTKMIRSDERIPQTVEDITVASLPVFAEWQQKLDNLGIKRT